MCFLLIRPQKAKQRAAQEMLNQLAPGDEVITIGGIYGDVVEVHDDKVVVEIAEDVHIEVARRAISSIVPPEAADHDAGEPLDDEYVEPVVTDEPEIDETPEPAREDKRWGVFGRRP